MAGCGDAGRKPQAIAIVDINLVMMESRAAREGQTHLKTVTATFQRGRKNLQAAAKRDPENRRKRTLAKGHAMLRQRICAEESVVLRMVRDVLVAEARPYRHRHGETASVVSSKTTPDAGLAMVVVLRILYAMFLRKATMSVLPDITVPPRTPAGRPLGRRHSPPPMKKGESARRRPGEVGQGRRPIQGTAAGGVMTAGTQGRTSRRPSHD
jgi:hypothetical protein